MKKVRLKQLNPITIIIGFIVVITLISLVILQIKQVSISRLTQGNGMSYNGFSENFLGSKATNGLYSQKFTEDEVCGYVKTYLGNYITSPICKFTDNHFVITGKANYALGSEGTVSALPINESGVLKTKLSDAKVGILPVPSLVLDRATDTINGLLNDNFNRYAKVKSFSFSGNIFTIYYETKGEK